VIAIHEAGDRERQLFYNALEWVEGPTLAGILAGKPVPPRQAALLVETLARAVHFAHEKGVIHRSLKPASVLLQFVAKADAHKAPAVPIAPPCCEVHGNRFVPRITDWGPGRRPVEGDVNDAELQGEYPCYLSPEQAWGRVKDIGPATDVYALGAILYELLASRPPFRESSPAATLDAIQCREAAPPSRHQPRTPADLDAVCRRCLAKHPKRRYASALELAADLRRWLNGQPVQARPISNAARFCRWLGRRRAALALMLVGAAACWGILSLAGPRQARPIPAPSVFRNQQDLKSVKALLGQAQEREAQAVYYRRIGLAARVLDADDTDRARDLLNGCAPEFRRWEWHYLEHRAAGHTPTKLAHNDRNQAVTSLAFRPAPGNGDALAAVAADGAEVVLWTFPGGKEHRLDLKLDWHVRAMAYSPNGFQLTLLLETDDGTVQRTLDAGSGEPLRHLRDWNWPREKVTGIDYSGDGAHILVANSGGRLRLLTYPGQIVLGQTGPYRGHGWGPHARVASLKSDGSSFAAVTPDGRGVVAWGNWQGGPTADAHSLHTDVVLALAAHPGTGRFATASRDRTARLWYGGGASVVLAGHQGAVTGAAFSADGQRLATCSDDGTVKVWEVAGGTEVLTLQGFDGKPTAVAFSADGGLLAVGHGGHVSILQGRPDDGRFP
jgi:WD40 repeat protein